MSGPLERCTLINNSINSSNLCSGLVEYDYYNYNVSTAQAAVFVTLFALLTIAHTVQGVLSKRWWLLPTFALCAVGEVLGWSGRLASAQGSTWYSNNGGYWTSPRTAFLIQISVLIFSPAFEAAGYYILLGRLIKRVGPQYSRINPTIYAVVFCLGDAASLITQAIGGGKAAAAETWVEADAGARIMVGGVFAQMAVMVLYCIVMADWVVRYFKDKPVKQFQFRLRRSNESQDPHLVPRDSVTPTANKKVKLLIATLIISTTFLFVRSIYRCAELLEGWNGALISNQMLFTILDGLMVFLSLLAFNIVHPLWCWPKKSEVGESHMEKVKSDPSILA